MKQILEQLFNRKTLSAEESKLILKSIAKGDYNAPQIASFLTVFIMRGIQIEELKGFRDAMLELCIPVDLSDFDPIDLCGTGGDGKDTFNISTLASFIVAGAGVKVAKHGNYGVSSISGSSNVIQHFGYQFTNDIDHIKSKIDKAGICFLHAPLFHPAMKEVAPVRKQMGVKTFFNMLGPMVNPARVRRQLVGVFNLDLARKYGYLYQQSDKRYAIVHALDGYDEVSLTGRFKLIRNEAEELLGPSDLGMTTVKAKELAGGKTVKEAADIFHSILKGDGTKTQNQVVCANAGLAIQCARPELGLTDAIALAKVSLDSKKALNSFETFIQN